jgi:hypothetical protein
MSDSKKSIPSLCYVLYLRVQSFWDWLMFAEPCFLCSRLLPLGDLFWLSYHGSYSSIGTVLAFNYVGLMLRYWSVWTNSAMTDIVSAIPDSPTAKNSGLVHVRWTAFHGSFSVSTLCSRFHLQIGFGSFPLYHFRHWFQCVNCSILPFIHSKGMSLEALSSLDF